MQTVLIFFMRNVDLADFCRSTFNASVTITNTLAVLSRFKFKRRFYLFRTFFAHYLEKLAAYFQVLVRTNSEVMRLDQSRVSENAW